MTYLLHIPEASEHIASSLHMQPIAKVSWINTSKLIKIKEMNPKCEISIKAFNDGELMTLNIYISHRTNNQDISKKCARKNRFVWRLNDELRDLGIPVYPNALAIGLKKAIWNLANKVKILFE